jgi:hypothetical protein
MLTEDATEKKLQPQMKKKGTALLAGFFPQSMQVKKFNVIGDLQNRAKITISYISRLKPEVQG